MERLRFTCLKKKLDTSSLSTPCVQDQIHWYDCFLVRPGHYGHLYARERWIGLRFSRPVESPSLQAGSKRLNVHWNGRGKGQLGPSASQQKSHVKLRD